MKKDTSLYVPQRDKLKHSLSLQTRIPFNIKQQQLVDLALDKATRIVLVKGPAGTAKTYLATYVALRMLNEKRMGEVIYIRNPVESSQFHMGFMPGTLEEKFQPYQQPLWDKLHEFLPVEDCKDVIKDERVRSLPVGFLRGLSFNSSIVIADEAQNFRLEDLLLIMSRMGRFSKLFLIGDAQQPDIKGSGFEKVYSLFSDAISKNHGIQTFEFGIDDIVRDENLKFIIAKFDALKASNGNGVH